MHCISCGSQLSEGAAHCPTCGVVTPYNISHAGASPYDYTVASSSSGAPQPKPATDYGSPPYGVPPQNPYGPLDPYDVSPKPPPPSSIRASSRPWVSIIIGVLGLLAVIASGVVSHTVTASQMTQSQSQILRIPALHASYTGYSFNAANNARYSLVITSLVENNATGDFTATGDLEGCTGSISGVVTTANEIRFEVIEQPSCQEHTFEYVGLIHDGTLSGTYTAPNFPVYSANYVRWFAS
jgi:hypothetical protein